MNSASELLESNAGKPVENSSANARFVPVVVSVQRARSESLFTVPSIANAAAGGHDLYRKPINSLLTSSELCCVICVASKCMILFCMQFVLLLVKFK